MERIFFELIQVAIGTRKSLTTMPTSQEWALLFEMSRKQSLMGICFVGVQKLSINHTPSTIHLPEALRFQWLGMAAKIQQRNQLVTEACVEVCKQYEHDGFDCCILKGQGNLVNYKTPSCSPCLGGGLDDTELGMFRTPGDIDIWMRPKGEIAIAVACDGGKGARYENYTGDQAVIEYVRQLWRQDGAKEMPLLRSHHIDAPKVRGVEVEAHFKPAIMCSPVHNCRLQRCFQIASFEEFQVAPDGFRVPSAGFNSVYQLVHIYRHLFTEGIGLRQLLDYYFVLRSLHNEQDESADRGATKFTQEGQTLAPALSKVEGCKNERQSIGQWAEGMGLSVPSNIEIMHTLSRLGMRRFASAVMWVLKEVFAMPSVYMICDPNERAGRFLLEEILQSGNFGQYDERNAEMRGASKLKRFGLLTMRNLRFVKEYPSEVLWDPYRRAASWLWSRWHWLLSAILRR